MTNNIVRTEKPGRLERMKELMLKPIDDETEQKLLLSLTAGACINMPYVFSNPESAEAFLFAAYWFVGTYTFIRTSALFR